jgi:Nif-specific regulatory protein
MGRKIQDTLKTGADDVSETPSERHVEQLGGLSSVAQSLSVHFGQGQVLHEVLSGMERELGLRRCTVMLLSPSGGELLFEASASATSAAGENAFYKRGEGVTGRVLETGAPAIVPRIGDEPAFRGRIHRRGSADDMSAGFVCVPISLAAQVVGTLAADVPADGALDVEDVKHVLSIVACMIAHDVYLRREARLRCQHLEEENVRLRGELEGFSRPENLKGNSRAMREVFRRIHQVAQTDTTVLIRGESGTGKELVASAIHYAGKRASGPFVKVNCAALSESLLESELFGHEKGAFTGATSTRIGRIEEANGGTLFLDEIGEFSPSLQAKLLRVFQQREFQRVGSNQTISVDIRILTATNRDLETAMAQQLIRQDFYYRINVFAIHVPPLRERRDDIMTLADHFVAKYAERLGKEVRRISTSAINVMYTYHWPGNVRELENCIEHAVLMSTDKVIHAYDLPPTLQTPDKTDGQTAGTLKSRVNLLERDMIIDALKRHQGRVLPAAQELGITERMARYKIKNLGIDYQRLFPKGLSRNRSRRHE